MADEPRPPATQTVADIGPARTARPGRQTEATRLPTDVPTTAVFGGTTYSVDRSACLVGYTGPVAPMITPWTVPADCPSMSIALGDFQSRSWSCWVPNFYQYWSCSSQMDYYSPAQCPSGYVAVDTRGTEGPQLASGETASFCCPSSYSYTNSLCSPSTSTTGMPGFYAIQIRWQSSDLSLFTAVSLGVTSSPLSTSNSGLSRPAETGTSRPTDSGTSLPPPPAASKSGLGTGAKAGIGAGVALGLVAVIAILVFFLLRRRRKAASQPAAPVEFADEGGANAPQVVDSSTMEKKGGTASNAPFVPELDSKDQPKALVQELPAPAYSTTAGVPLQPPYPNAQHELDSQPSILPAAVPELSSKQDKQPSWSQLEVVAAEGIEVVPPDPREEERARIREELAKTEARRERLREMHSLEYEEEQLRQRLAQLEKGP
ncbi:hypothetical protein IQ07DRAFT_592374 [Pyrenochaeta sp. DS3sAY3a]|nr:hypothetical protein IQ07DRAFT_592374 [Pyrenochaeta sp. DS3sAY3a]